MKTRLMLRNSMAKEDRYLDFEHKFLWIGTHRECFGYVDKLRALRALHAGLGRIIAKRARKKKAR